MMASSYSCYSDFIVAGGFSTETHGLTSNFIGEMLVLEIKETFKPQKKGLQFGETPDLTVLKQRTFLDNNNKKNNTMQPQSVLDE